MLRCEKCEKEAPSLLPLIRDDDETIYLCPRCWGYEDARADAEYERQKEEGTCFGS
jgi:hypothetical protein